AMIMRSRSSELRAKLCQQLRKVGEAGRNHARIVDRNRLARGKAKREKGHGNAMIQVRRNETAAFDLSLSHNNEIVALDARLYPVGGKARKRRIFVDHRRRAFGRNDDTLERSCPHSDVAHRLAALEAMIELLDIRAQLAQSLD